MNRIMRVKVVYEGYLAELDRLITGAFEDAGLRWYAQGHNFISDERDICFEYKEEANND